MGNCGRVLAEGACMGWLRETYGCGWPDWRYSSEVAAAWTTAARVPIQPAGRLAGTGAVAGTGRRHGHGRARPVGVKHERKRKKEITVEDWRTLLPSILAEARDVFPRDGPLRAARQ